MKTRSFIHLRRTVGSALITVIIFTFATAMLVASILSWSLTERRLNTRNAYWIEARTAAEALAEYGFAQILDQYKGNPNPPTLDPQPGIVAASGSTPANIPLSLPPSTFFKPNTSPTDSHICTNKLTDDPNGMELIGGYVSPATGGIIGSANQYVIDPNDPNNQNDPDKGDTVTRIDVMVVAKATAVPPDGSAPITAFVRETESVRNSTYLKDAIFYSNNDLEIAPGPDMNIYGAVHVNGNMFVSCQGGSSVLNFHYPVSITGNLYHAWGNQAHAGEGSGVYTDKNGNTHDGEALGSSPVNFLSAPATAKTSEVLLSLKDSSGTWDDSTMGTDQALFSGGLYTNTTKSLLSVDGSGNPTGQLNSLTVNTYIDPKTGKPAVDPKTGQPTNATNNDQFNKYASQTWNGNVKTGIMGAQPENPVGLTKPIGQIGGVDYLPNTDQAESGANSDGNNISNLNDPPDQKINTIDPSSDPYYDGKQALEKAKFSTKCDLYVLVTVTPGTGGASASSRSTNARRLSSLVSES